MKPEKAIQMRAANLLLAFATVFLANAVAETCSDYVPKKEVNNNSKFAYQLRDGSRCEGLYVSKVSAPALELISLTLGKIRFDAGHVLRVSAPGYDRQVHVLGTAVPAKKGLAAARRAD